MQRTISVNETLPDGWRIVTPWFDRTYMIEPIPSSPYCTVHDYCDLEPDHAGDCRNAAEAS